MDACMEVDGRVGERRGNIYIKKDINMGRLYNYCRCLCYMIYASLCVFAHKAVPYFILFEHKSLFRYAII